MPPAGAAYTGYDDDGDELWASADQPASAETAAYARTTYSLYSGDALDADGGVSCEATPPSPSLPCATVDADGNVTQLSYDAEGDLVSASTPDGNGDELSTTTYGYDADGEATWTTSPDGNVAGADAADYTTTTAYDADGETTSTTEAGGEGATVAPRTASYAYDADGNQTTSTDALGDTTTTAYDADDEPDLVTGPDGDATLTCYDGDGDTTETVPPIGVAAGPRARASCPTSYSLDPPTGYGDRLAPDATT